MKWQLAIVVASALLCTIAYAAEEDIEDLLDDLDFEADEALLREIEEKSLTADLQRENEAASEIAAEHAAMEPPPNTVPVQVDPCTKVHCGAGRVCQAKGTTASCVCIPQCPEELDPRRKVCTNRNETWSSDCEVYRHRCLCDTNDASCKGKDLKHIHINYYGECKSMPDCGEDEMKDFPRRMRDWLFNVMRDLAERHELPEHYMTLQMEAETNLTRRWANAAVWKWCDLDGHPHDRSVSRHELFPIRAPLMSLEHCIEPFFESCDTNNDHRISLKEWGICLEINEEDMLDRCDEISKDEAAKVKAE